jgi:hypothetical protein
MHVPLGTQGDWLHRQGKTPSSYSYWRFRHRQVML